MSSDTQTNPNPVIPSHWKIKRSTHFFTKDKVPNALLTHQYWHRVELSDDAQFNINFWTEGDTGNKSMFNSSKIHSKPIEKLFDKPEES